MWEVRVFTGNDARGKPTQTSRTVRGTKRDAERLAASLEVGAGSASPAGRKVSDVLEAWIDQNLDTTATTGRDLYVGMTRGRDENHALVVADTPDLAEAVSTLEAAIAIDRADIPATTHRRMLAEAVPRSRPRPRVQIPEWFDELGTTAEETRRSAQRSRRLARWSADRGVTGASASPARMSVELRTRNALEDRIRARRQRGSLRPTPRHLRRPSEPSGRAIRR